MQRLWVLLTMTALLLSGCASDAQDETAAECTEDCGEGQIVPETTETPTEATEGNVTNSAGTALMALLTGPANVTLGDVAGFSIETSDDAAWTLDADGDGAADHEGTGSALVNHTYEAAGSFVALLNATDGTRSTSSAWNVTVIVPEVEAPTGPEPIFTILEMVEGCWLCVDGGITPAADDPGAVGCVGWQLNDNELDCGWVAISPEYVGLPFSLFSYTSGTLPELSSDGDPDYEFWDSCDHDGTMIARDHGGTYGAPKAGIIPEGAGCLVAYEFSWPNVGHSIEFSIGADVHTGA